MHDIAEITDRTITVSRVNPHYDAILEGWPHWGFLHDRPQLGKVTMSVDPGMKTLKFAVSAPETADIGDAIIDFYDLVMGAASAWEDTYTYDPEFEAAGGVEFYLTRNSRCRRESHHYTHADLAVKTHNTASTFPGIAAADLRRVGQFFLDYADKMESEHRDDLA